MINGGEGDNTKSSPTAGKRSNRISRRTFQVPCLQIESACAVLHFQRARHQSSDECRSCPGEFTPSVKTLVEPPCHPSSWPHCPVSKWGTARLSRPSVSISHSVTLQLTRPFSLGIQLSQQVKWTFLEPLLLAPFYSLPKPNRLMSAFALMQPAKLLQALHTPHLSDNLSVEHNTFWQDKGKNKQKRNCLILGAFGSAGSSDQSIIKGSAVRIPAMTAHMSKCPQAKHWSLNCSPLACQCVEWQQPPNRVSGWLRGYVKHCGAPQRCWCEALDKHSPFTTCNILTIIAQAFTAVLST